MEVNPIQYLKIFYFDFKFYCTVKLLNYDSFMDIFYNWVGEVETTSTSLLVIFVSTQQLFYFPRQSLLTLYPCFNTLTGPTETRGPLLTVYVLRLSSPGDPCLESSSLLVTISLSLEGGWE